MLVLEDAEYEKVLAACPRMCTLECVKDKGKSRLKQKQKAEGHPSNVVFVVEAVIGVVSIL